MELELPEDINNKPVEVEVELTKPRKKKVYTAPKTDKQLENFDKAKQIRLERINKKKLEDQEKLIKQILDNEKKIKKSKKQKKVLIPENKIHQVVIRIQMMMRLLLNQNQNQNLNLKNLKRRLLYICLKRNQMKNQNPNLFKKVEFKENLQIL